MQNCRRVARFVLAHPAWKLGADLCKPHKVSGQFHCSPCTDIHLQEGFSVAEGEQTTSEARCQAEKQLNHLTEAVAASGYQAGRRLYRPQRLRLRSL